MSDDTISRQAAIDAIDKYIGKFDCIDVNFLDGLKTTKKILNDLPSAERHGRWIYKSELYSYCGHPFYPKICSVCNGVFEYTTNYCPNCGAKMDGDTE